MKENSEMVAQYKKAWLDYCEKHFDISYGHISQDDFSKWAREIMQSVNPGEQEMSYIAGLLAASDFFEKAHNAVTKVAAMEQKSKSEVH